jgi:thymidylate synthase
MPPSPKQSTKKVSFKEIDESPAAYTPKEYTNAQYLIEKNKQLRSEWEESEKKFRRYNPNYPER